MCPMCIASAAATVALLAGGGASAGGVSTLIVRWLRPATAGTKVSTSSAPGGTHEPPEDRVVR
jgi:hypothetical protein